ncbi:MAG: cytochrome b/b6 domain-containing protein [Sphingomonadales bacterium]|nr:cytochrome b/b6 domain-containing protein [Sphingomonadales bacterium]
MGNGNTVAVWDLPTRLFHWLLAGLFAFSWFSAENGLMDWHRISGETLVGLLAFRLVWGFVGGSTARFASFVASPGKALAYLRGGGTAAAGHNPLGAWSVIALLLLIAVQVGTGLFSVDTDGLESGPLSYLVSFEAGRKAAGVHHLAFNLTLLLVILHVAAILFYRVVKRRNLVTPMITGRDGELPPGTPGLIAAPISRFAIVAALAAILAWYVAKGLTF